MMVCCTICLSEPTQQKVITNLQIQIQLKQVSETDTVSKNVVLKEANAMMSQKLKLSVI